MPGRLLAGLLAGLLGGCATRLPAACAPGDVGRPADRTAWVVDDAWHTAIALPADELAGPLAGFRRVFPGVRVLLFGYGKRTWITARVETPGELLLGPFPGPGAMQVVGLRLPPQAAYPAARVLRLTLDAAQAQRLDGVVWASFATRPDGAIRVIGPGLFPGSLFYGARQGYGLGHDCNRWTADALRAAGLAIQPDGVILPGGLMSQLPGLPRVCRAAG